MNSPIHINHEIREFVKKDRIRLIHERNQFKQKVNDLELALAQSHERNQKMIAILLTISVILIGVLVHAISS